MCYCGPGEGGGSLRCHADFLLQSGTSGERLSGMEGGRWGSLLVFECYSHPQGNQVLVIWLFIYLPLLLLAFLLLM